MAIADRMCQALQAPDRVSEFRDLLTLMETDSSQASSEMYYNTMHASGAISWDPSAYEVIEGGGLPCGAELFSDLRSALVAEAYVHGGLQMDGYTINPTIEEACESDLSFISRSRPIVGPNPMFEQTKAEISAWLSEVSERWV